MSPQEYDSLLQRAIDRDQSAFELLVALHRAKVLSVIRVRLDYALDYVEDVFQELTMDVWRDLPKFRRDQGTFESWFWRIARNKAVNVHREHAKRGRAIGGNLDSNSRADKIAEPAAKDSTPSRKAAREEQRPIVHDAIRQLSERHRMAVLLRDVEELRYVEIAELMELTEGQVKNIVRTARRRLKETLGSESKFFTRVAS